ncbi:recombinase family protein [Streptomyces bluensis]
MITTEYDGCGKCLVGVRRLSRMKDATNSPEKQLDQVLSAVVAIGGHVIAWADDWEVSGATNPLDRPGLGPWLRGEMGPYSGIAGAAVDRIGRNARDVLNTAYTIHESKQVLVTADHPGVWDLDDPNQESELLVKSLGAQLEHRAIKKRIQDETIRARKAGQPKQKPFYSHVYARLTPRGKVDHVELHPEAAETIRNVAQRILNDETGTITVTTECARLNREGVLSPSDQMAVNYGREPKGTQWRYRTLWQILNSQAALGYLMHKERPVLGETGHPIQIAPPLWDRATHDALVEKTAPKQQKHRGKPRSPQGTRLCSGLSFCGNCGQRLIVGGLGQYGCTARVRGILSSAHCKPAPGMQIHLLDKEAKEWFLGRYGSGQLMKRQYDPGTGYAAQIRELEEDRKRLREDRNAGLYDAEDDKEWYRQEYSRMGREIAELKKLPERPAGMRMVPTGKTVADEWHAAKDDAARRELMTSFNVRIEVFPRGAAERVRITGDDIWSQSA